MEKFEIDGEKGLELFGSFVTKAKNAFSILIENIKTNIKEYETKIEDTAKEISDNEISREKCENEITKMEGKIETIKDAIENVENTYKKMVDAYSSTSKGETKELYSEIIDGARANCEKDVEKNRSEIARLNSDIEAIKNNISEFTKIIDELNKDLDDYNTELFRYTKSLEYFEKTSEEAGTELERIGTQKEEAPKKESKTTKKGESKKTSTKSRTTQNLEENKQPNDKDKMSSVLDTFEPESFKTEEATKEEQKETTANEISYEESLKQIYDLTGYKPSQSTEGATKEVSTPTNDAPVFTDNLENLFSVPSADIVPDKEPKKDENISSFLDTEFSNWENILNSATTAEEKPSTKNATKSIATNVDETANQLLNPYGTSMERLRSVVGKEIVYKNGDRIPFELTGEDIIKVVNSVDGNDLKKMKTVGPEITLLRKVKEMKEGNRQ